MLRVASARGAQEAWRRGISSTRASSSSSSSSSISSSSSSASSSSSKSSVTNPPTNARAMFGYSLGGLGLSHLASLDRGQILMNVGAIVSLSGFCMSDVLLLRCMSIFGSTCGIIYNFTRVPRQMNAVAWGCVFMSVNFYHVRQLLLERQEHSYTTEELLLYTTHFRDWVAPSEFRKLLSHATWQTVRKGHTIIEEGKPLAEVVLIHQGEGAAVDPVALGQSKDPIPTYKYKYGAGGTGCIIGGTALVDPAVRRKLYPHRVIAAAETVIVKWDTDSLIQVMKHNKGIESAVLHACYIELIRGLRHDRLVAKGALIGERNFQREFPPAVAGVTSDVSSPPMSSSPTSEADSRELIPGPRSKALNDRVTGKGPKGGPSANVLDEQFPFEAELSSATALAQVLSRFEDLVKQAIDHSRSEPPPLEATPTISRVEENNKTPAWPLLRRMFSRGQKQYSSGGDQVGGAAAALPGARGGNGATAGIAGSNGGSGDSGVIHPWHKRRVREFVDLHRIPKAQQESILAGLGWTLEEWEDGAKLETTR